MKINFERIKYSPFGKKITTDFKFAFIGGLLSFPLMLLFSLIFFAISIWFGIFMIPFTVGIPILIAYYVSKQALLQSRLLSAMTDEEHNKLILEYKNFEERNLTRFGHLTSYGIVLDTHILPWESIKQIRFVPGEYRLVYRRNHGRQRVYSPAKIKVTAVFGTKSTTITSSLHNEDYDLSDEIASFLTSIPKYTEHKFEVLNRYYYAK